MFTTWMKSTFFACAIVGLSLTVPAYAAETYQAPQDISFTATSDASIEQYVLLLPEAFIPNNTKSISSPHIPSCLSMAGHRMPATCRR
jgi:hypothetical protein